MIRREIVVMKNRYTVIYEKSGSWWAVRVEGLPGALSQGKTLNEARENIKEAISMMLEANGQATGVIVSPDDVLREDVTVAPAKARTSAAKPRKSSRPAKLVAAGER
jgi:predicted RNase H-like HicB family nuclease